MSGMNDDNDETSLISRSASRDSYDSYDEDQPGAPMQDYDDADPHATSRAEFTTAFDIIDELTTKLSGAKTSFFAPEQIKIDRDEFIDDLNNLKKVLPVQLERASALMRESEKRLETAQHKADSIVEEAQRNAAKIIDDANEQAEFLAGRQNVLALAEDKAKALLEEAQSKADRLTDGANAYSTDVLTTLNDQLTKLQRDVQGGLNVLHQREQQASANLAPHPDDQN